MKTLDVQTAKKALIVVGILAECAASIAAQSVSVDFGSYPAGTSVGALNVPNIDFVVEPGASAQIDGGALVYTQQVASARLPFPPHFIETSGLVMSFKYAGVTPQYPMRVSSISFDWAVTSQSSEPTAVPFCAMPLIGFVTDADMAMSINDGTIYGTRCSGDYYMGHFEFQRRAVTAIGLVFPFFEGQASGSPNEIKLLIFNLEATAAPPCTLEAPEITSHPAIPPPFGDATITAGNPVVLAWNPSKNLDTNAGSYVVETQRAYGGPPELVKGTTDTSLSIPVAASETDYSLYVSVKALEYCYPRGPYVYSGWSTRKFTVKAGGVLQSRPAILQVPPRPPVRRISF